MGLASVHISPIKESDRVKGRVVITCVGKQQPSQQALERFVEVYKKMVRLNQEKDQKNQRSE